MQRLISTLFILTLCLFLTTVSAGATPIHMLTMEPDGTNMQLVFTDSSGVGWGRWSPDMTEIAYPSTAASGSAEVFVYELATDTRCQLTDHGSTYGPGDPMYLNDTTIWYYRSSGTGGGELGELILDGCTVLQDSYLTNFGSQEGGDFDISENYLCVQIQNDSHGPSGELYLAPKNDIGNLTQLTSNSSSDRGPDISPDEMKIVYTHEPSLGSTRNIRVMDIDGSNMVQITTETGDFQTLQYRIPLWSPDMSQICYSRKEGEQWDVWTMNPDGTNKTNITNTPDISETAWEWHSNGTLLITADSLPDLSTTGELLFPTVTVKPCDEIDQGCVAQPVMTNASAPLNGATIPVAIPEGVEVCSVSTYGCITETWDYTYIFDYSVDSGFVFVSLANSTGETLPADTATVFNIYYHAERLCNEDVVYHFDTTLYDDVSRQLLFSDEGHAMIRPEFDAMMDSAIVKGYVPGDIIDDDVVNIMDLTFMVTYMFEGGGSICIMNSLDINGDCCGPNIADMTYLIDYLFGTGAAPLCGCLEQGCPVMKATFAANVWAEYDGNETVIHLSTEQMLRGLELTLVGEGTAEPHSLVKGAIEMVHGYHAGGMLRVGLVDMQGAAHIESGSQAVLRVPGEFRIADAYGSDMDHKGVPMTAAASAPVVPTEFALHQNYPNPFNPTTTIGFDSPEAADYTLTVYNTLGQVVECFEGVAQAGENSVTWDASSSSSGVYFYKLEIGNNSETKKMMLLK